VPRNPAATAKSFRPFAREMRAGRFSKDFILFISQSNRLECATWHEKQTTSASAKKVKADERETTVQNADERRDLMLPSIMQERKYQTY